VAPHDAGPPVPPPPMSVAADRLQSPGGSGLADRVASWLSIYSDAAARIARFVLIVSIVLCAGTVAVNVFTRHVLNFSIIGQDELASDAFLWTIWMGVSLAVRRGEVTVITILRDRGPAWWRSSVRTFSGVSLALLLAYCDFRSTQYAFARETTVGTTALLRLPQIYGVASMTFGYYLISLHYLAMLARVASRFLEDGRDRLRRIAVPVVGASAIALVVWAAAKLVLSAGGSPLIAIGIVFVALTLAGNPIIFMLSIVGIIAITGIAGLSFYPSPDVLFPFRTTQSVMGLAGFTELTVILMFLVVAEVMNASGMSDLLIRFAASIVGHLRGGMAYVCQVTSALVSGISGSATADAAIMTPMLVPAMVKEGYPKDVAAAVVAGASIKGPIGPISIMFIAYGIYANTSIAKLLLSGIMAVFLLFTFQAATVYVVVRRLGFSQKRPFAGVRTVARTGLAALPVLLIPVIIVGGLLRGVFYPSEAGAAAMVVALLLALFWYGTLSPRDLPRILTVAGLETGIVMLLVGDSAILGKALQNNGFGTDLSDFLTGLTDNKYVFLLAVNVLLLLIGLFLEPLPAIYIFAPFLAPVAESFHINATHFGLIMVFNLVLALIHPPIGLVLFLVSSIAKVRIERLSIVIIPWLLVSLFVLFLITYLPSSVVLVVVNHGGAVAAVFGIALVAAIAVFAVAESVRAMRRRARPRVL
jgi:tripartite ATP-independent transporter DctM subunit